MKVCVSLAIIALSASMLQTGQQSNLPKPPPPATEISPNAAEKYFTDIALVDQDGKERRFYTDLLKNKTVVINVFFASCQASCPALEGNLSRIQKSLGPLMESFVRIISITIDPETDTSSRLKELATKLDAHTGWYFLTGKKENIEFTLRKLGLYAEKKEDHSALFIIGNVRTGLWKKNLGLSNTDDLIASVRATLQDGQ
jgi:protein SCO1/2